MCAKFNEDELGKILDNLESKNWIKDFNGKRDFIKNVCELEFTSPQKEDVFKAFELFEPEKTRILILGQDPYPEKDKAHGLAFSVANGKTDASLLNIFKAIQSYNKYDKTVIKEWETNLEIWATTNKVLLLNTALTYEETNLHKDIDKKTKKQKNEIKNEQKKLTKKHQAVWKTFIKNIILKLLTCNSGKLVIFLWGDDSRKLFNDCTTTLLKTDRNCIKKQILALISNHPSPISINNYGNFPILAPTHFKACDEFLGTDIWKNFPENNQKNT